MNIAEQARKDFPIGTVVEYSNSKYPKVQYVVIGYCDCDASTCDIVKTRDLKSSNCIDYFAYNLSKYVKPTCSQCK